MGSVPANSYKWSCGGPHDEAEGEFLATKALEILELLSNRESLAGLWKRDCRKVLVAHLLCQRTSVGNSWLSDRLAMGHSASVSRLVADFKRDKDKLMRLEKIEGMLECNAWYHLNITQFK